MMKFYIDCSVNPEKNELSYQMINDRGKTVGSVSYGRSHIREQKCLLVRVLEWRLEKEEQLDSCQIGFRKVLSKMERSLIHQVFPYIPVYRNLWDFLHLYEKYNPSFDYEEYEAWRDWGKQSMTQLDESFSGIWECVKITDEKTVLCCRWKDTDGNHVVIVDEQMYYSDVCFEKLCKKEVCFECCSDADLSAFMSAHPNSMLDVYVKHGGRRVLYFLTSPRYDHTFELLSKAGLAELADHSDQYRGINRQGTHIREIFNLPVRCLRTFHWNNDMMLYSREDRQVIKWAYEKCPDLFDDSFSAIKELWFRYCYQYSDLRVFDEKTLEDILRPSTRYLIRQVKQTGNPYQVFGLYENYLRYSLRIGSFFFGHYPTDLEKAVDACVEYLQKQYEESKAGAFYEAVHREEYAALEDDLDYEPYRIVAPQSAEQLVEAGAVLCNCLKNYVSKIKRQQTMIGLIYEKEKSTLIGAVEIKGRDIIQAKGPYNGRLSSHVEEYLKRYSKRKEAA